MTMTEFHPKSASEAVTPRTKPPATVVGAMKKSVTSLSMLGELSLASEMETVTLQVAERGAKGELSVATMCSS